MQDTISQAEIQDSQNTLKEVINVTPIDMGENNVLVKKITWENASFYLDLLFEFLEKLKEIFKNGGIKKWQFWKWGKLAWAAIKLVISINGRAK